MPSSPGMSGSSPAAHRGKGTLGGLFMTIAVVLFVLSLLSIGGAYAYKYYLLSSNASGQAELAVRQKQFNLDQISLMKAESTKIALARQLLDSHLATSKVFSVLSQITTENVRFTSMEMTVPPGMSPISLSLFGYGRDYPSVAFQSDVLNNLAKYNLNATVKNAIVSNPNLNRNGTVAFSLTAQIDPSGLLYRDTIGSLSSGGSSPASGTGSVQGTTAPSSN